MEWKDFRRYERICRYISRLLPGFAHFDLEENQGKVALRWQSDWSSRSFGAHHAAGNVADFRFAG